MIWFLIQRSLTYEVHGFFRNPLLVPFCIPLQVTRAAPYCKINFSSHLTTVSVVFCCPTSSCYECPVVCLLEMLHKTPIRRTIRRTAAVQSKFDIYKNRLYAPSKRMFAAFPRKVWQYSFCRLQKYLPLRNSDQLHLFPVVLHVT